MTDLEKSGVSVRTLVLCLLAVILTGGGLIATGAYSWAVAQDHARSQDDKLSEIVDTLKEDKTERLAKVESDRQRDQQILMLMQQGAALQKRMDDYRAFKWSTPMMQNYGESFHAKNPTIDVPDAQAIHDKIINYTP